MIEITKNEATCLRKAVPTAHIRRTSNKWYAEETSSSLSFLADMGNVSALRTLRENCRAMREVANG